MPHAPSAMRPARRILRALAATLLALAAGLGTATGASASQRAVTDALIWVGASERVARRSLDRRDRAAVRFVERRLGGRTDGRLDGGETRALLAAADRIRAREGYRVVNDPATGARIGLPTAWLAGRADTADGSAWRSPDGALAVETFAIPGGLDAFERAERRGVSATYVAGRGDWRVVSGLAPGGRTVYARAARRDGAAIGFRVTYDTALGHRLDRVAVAMSSDFRVPDDAPAIDALAYAPSAAETLRDDGRFEPMTPRYAVLPRVGPSPRDRPRTSSVASLGTVRDVPRAVRPRALAPAAPARPVPDPDVPTAPLSLGDDADAVELAPVRGDVRATTPDDGRTEDAIPRTITGFVTDEGQSCPTLRGPDGTLYALTGEVPALTPGTLVEVEAVGVDTERCSAGRTVAVGALRVRATP